MQTCIKLIQNNIKKYKFYKKWLALRFPFMHLTKDKARKRNKIIDRIGSKKVSQYNFFSNHERKTFKKRKQRLLEKRRYYLERKII